MTETGTPYVKSARLSGAWLILNIRTEAFMFSQTAHVRADVQSTDSATLDTAIHAHVTFDSDTKSQTVRFKLSATPEVGIEPIVPVPETNSGTPLDHEQFPDAVKIELTILKTDSEQEYDQVTIDIDRDDDKHKVTAIHD